MNIFVHAFKLVAGLFIPNKHCAFHLQVLQVISRFTWEILQTLAGFLSALVYVLLFKVRRVSYSNGAVVVRCKSKFGAFTLGCYVIGDREISGNPSQRLFQHEYGHYLQSIKSGPVYLVKYGWPSLVSAWRYSLKQHCKNTAEVDANIRAKKYWDTHYQQHYRWNLKYNPMHEEVVPDTLKWYDFMPVYFPLIHLVKAFKK
ncbi:MAG TPA: hypothetical protein VD905_12535 [Flavobacteriales bacterium]|nr:hypothetical protein [Flavobacteriales bacterium]